MISKKEHENARVRVLRRLALIASGGCFMAMGFYVGFGIYWGGVLLAFATVACLGYARGGSDEDGDAI